LATVYSIKAAARKARTYSLKILSGRDKGSQFAFGDSDELVVGRSRDVDLVLIEGMVSRRHARFVLMDDGLSVEDLGSTNGTFVNGKQVTGRHLLAESDRILVGTAILKVVRQEDRITDIPPSAPSLEPSSEVTFAAGSTMGDLAAVGVGELLELLDGSSAMAVVELNARDGIALVTVEEGYVVDCRIPALPDAPALKCIHRALGYDKGSYRVLKHRRPPAKRLFQRIPELLVDGGFKFDELQLLLARLPDTSEHLLLAHPLPKLASMDERDLEVLRAVHNHRRVGTILDASKDTDVEVAKSLLFLLDSGYLKKV
jgi:hypothetical protein